MCAQCWQSGAGVAAAMGGASGLRAWIGTKVRVRERLGERGMRRLTVALFTVAAIGSSLTLSGSGA